MTKERNTKQNFIADMESKVTNSSRQEVERLHGIPTEKHTRR